MGRLFDAIEQYRQRFAPHPPAYARIAEQVGVSRQTLLNWETPTKLIDKEHLVALSEITGYPYERLLDALLEDIGYLRREQTAVAARRNPKRPRRGPKEQSAD